MANINIANIRAPKAPNLPIPGVVYSQTYFEILTNVLRLYFTELDKLSATVITPDIGYYLNAPYGGFSDSTTQHIAVINTAYPITFDTTDIQDGPRFNFGQPDILINPLASSQIIIGFPGVYNFQFSLQLTSTNASTKIVYIWARLNGVDVPNSATKISMSGTNNAYVAAWNFLLETFTSGEYFELMWAADSTNVDLTAAPATAFCPAIPSVILTVTYASA
jgi:hypothetical protein